MANAENSTKTPLWMRITLFVSIALNMLVVGIVAGFFVTGGPDGRADRDRRDSGSLFTRALGPEDRRVLRREFMANLPEQGRDASSIVSDMQTALDALRATPFDPQAFAQAISDQSDRRSQREQVGRRVLAARIAAMSDTERTAYADRVEQELKKLAQKIRR